MSACCCLSSPIALLLRGLPLARPAIAAPHQPSVPAIRRPRASPPISHQISLYAHITGLAFALDTINAPVHKATISDPSGNHELRNITINAAGRTPFETANEIWSLL